VPTGVLVVEIAAARLADEVDDLLGRLVEDVVELSARLTTFPTGGTVRVFRGRMLQAILK
jgi:hypothetical protein